MALFAAVSGVARADCPVCPYEDDGVCDEPRVCPLGTDAVDCAAVCAKDPDLAPVACSFRGAPPPPAGPPAVPAANGSNGTGGVRGTWDGSLTAAGPRPNTEIQRFFRVYVPQRYDPAVPAPILYVMGGFRLSMYTLASYTEIERTADQNGFIAVLLEADWRDFGPQAGGWVWAWYVYGAGATQTSCCPACSLDPNYAEWEPVGDWGADPDVDFVRKLTAQLEGLYNVDRSRIFVSGHSRGAGEAIILAYELPGLIAGYDCESGFADVNGFDRVMAAATGRRIPGVIVHGEADQDVPFCSGKDIVDTLVKAGYVEGQDFLFYDLPGVTHRWQSWLNQPIWDFLSAHPLPLPGGSP